MAVVHLRINGREYDIACDNGQEDHLRLLADDIDDRVRSLVFRMGANPGESMGLLLAALTMADELIENKKELQKVAAEVKRMGALVEGDQKQMQELRLREIEASMAATLEEVAVRIEKIAGQIEAA